MSHLNMMGDLHREYHYLKVLVDSPDEPEYQPCMTVINYNRKGRLWAVSQQALWKYIDPEENVDALAVDMASLLRIVEKSTRMMRLTNFATGSESYLKAKQDGIDCKTALKLSRSTGILPTVCFNLIKCLRMMEITIGPDSVSQLLMFVQDGLDQLKNMPPFAAPFVQPEDSFAAGEVTLWEGSTKLGTQEIRVTESDLLQGVEYPEKES